MDTVEIRAATAEDLEQIVRLKFEMFRESGHLALWAPDAANLVLTDYRDMYRLGQAMHFVLGSPIGAMAGAFLKSDIPYRYFVPPTYGFVGDVYTEPRLRRRGWSEALNKAALAWLRSQGVRTVRLLASAAGRPLYEKLGFTASDEMVLLDAS